MATSNAIVRNNSVRIKSFWKAFRKLWPVYLLVLPAVLWRFIYTIIPMVETFRLSMTSKSLVNPGHFIGLTNFINLAQDDRFFSTFGVTVYYTVASTLLETALGLGFAILMTQKLKGQSFFNVALLIPWAVAPMLAAQIWRVMLYENSGIVNEIIRMLGFHLKIPFLTDPNVAKISIVIVTLWKNVSWVTLLFIAGLKGIQREIVEAAAVDGASAWQRFRFVTFPMLIPTTVLVLLLRSMGEVQTFEQVYGLTTGGPGAATKLLALYAFERFFQEFRYGYGATVNIVLLFITVAIGGSFAWRLYRSERM